jgi:hypothetical protein
MLTVRLIPQHVPRTAFLGVETPVFPTRRLVAGLAPTIKTVSAFCMGVEKLRGSREFSAASCADLCLLGLLWSFFAGLVVSLCIFSVARLAPPVKAITGIAIALKVIRGSGELSTAFRADFHTISYSWLLFWRVCLQTPRTRTGSTPTLKSIGIAFVVVKELDSRRILFAAFGTNLGLWFVLACSLRQHLFVLLSTF